MAQQAIQITGEEYQKKQSDSATRDPALDADMTSDEAIEKTEVDEINAARQKYSLDRQSKTKEWVSSYKAYSSWLDETKNPFLSNMFIPKVHEAVEILAAWLIGDNQSITASPENNDDTIKAVASEKWLDFLWRKVLKARMKILVWIKQGIVFGNGIMKVGWDASTGAPFMHPCAIEDVYFDFFEPDIQDSEYIIHEVRRDKAEVMKDAKYDKTYTDKSGEKKLIREMVICGGEKMNENGVRFGAYDKAQNEGINKDKVLLREAWCKSNNHLYTIAPTGNGWRVLRKQKNPNEYQRKDADGIPFRPFVKLRFKVSPVPNRAYDTGAIYPTVRLQNSFNDLINEYFDNVVLVNNKMWIKRRGARINPAELVRRPGGIITVSNIEKDLKADETSDIKSSIIEMLNRLDNEFQQASMVVNILKAIPGSKLATEVAIGQQNVETILDMLDENIADALSELGQMVLAISFANYEKTQTIKLYETDAEFGILNFLPKDISGMIDLIIKPDRKAGSSKVVQQKQLADFVALVAKDPETRAKYPTMMERLYRRWLELGGFGDINYFFEQVALPPTAVPLTESTETLPPAPGRDKLLTEEAMMRSAGAIASPYTP